MKMIAKRGAAYPVPFDNFFELEVLVDDKPVKFRVEDRCVVLLDEVQDGQHVEIKRKTKLKMLDPGCTREQNVEAINRVVCVLEDLIQTANKKDDLLTDIPRYVNRVLSEHMTSVHLTMDEIDQRVVGNIQSFGGTMRDVIGRLSKLEDLREEDMVLRSQLLVIEKQVHELRKECNKTGDLFNAQENITHNIKGLEQRCAEIARRQEERARKEREGRSSRHETIDQILGAIIRYKQSETEE
jgi:hypothetical protein